MANGVGGDVGWSFETCKWMAGKNNDNNKCNHRQRMKECGDTEKNKIETILQLNGSLQMTLALEFFQFSSRSYA